ncbi:hypothetical protein BGX34_000342 [Mortierella sp. NVP85]|nr:hypothetical protein BGX34_000342 [Mortierella sp. NVP85]
MELPLHSSATAESSTQRHHAYSVHSTHSPAQPASTSTSVQIPMGMAPLQIDTASIASGGNRSLPSPEPSSAEDFYEARDPLMLESKRMSEDQIRAIRSNKKVREFYREQNELIAELLDPAEGREGAQEQEERNQVKLKIAIYGSFSVNVMLFLLQLYAAISSKSLSLFATMADAFMDLLSGVILTYAATVSTKSNNWFKYPSGKSRMETAGTIVFASLMATVSLQLIIESVRTLIGNDQSPPMPNALAITFVGIALGSKFLLFLYCRAISQYNAANILATDHRNDLLVNGFGLFASLLSRYCWWLDAAGAIVVSIIILRSWVWTAYEQVQLIVGKTADPAILKKLTYIGMTKSMVYCSIKLEALPNVERAFVHVDYETSHAPEHRKMK